MKQVFSLAVILLSVAVPARADMGNIGPGILIIPAAMLAFVASVIALPLVAIWALRRLRKIKLEQSRPMATASSPNQDPGAVAAAAEPQPSLPPREPSAGPQAPPQV